MKIRPKIANTALRPLFRPAAKHPSPLKMAVSGSFLASRSVEFGGKRLYKLLQSLSKELCTCFIGFTLLWTDTRISDLSEFLGPGVSASGLEPWVAPLGQHGKPGPPCSRDRLPMPPLGRNPWFRALGRDSGNARKAPTVGYP